MAVEPKFPDVELSVNQWAPLLSLLWDRVILHTSPAVAAAFDLASGTAGWYCVRRIVLHNGLMLLKAFVIVFA
jgi:hypothetical protein